ncbi:thyroid hormone receptor-associated protein 3b isoform X1 [Alosa pseudoharengus]|uniref:thyroid hormone receptor-associated protein 3b isoform X1 n=1 Tax=Alosa pseudoharengus TaxID=34774 RepID=UPI003F8904B8
MSKPPNSPSRSRSRSASRSRSRSYTRSRSRSRSRSRKHRYSSRSRSRSRSHSPSHGRERNYPSRDYQNNRGGYRGYNRGFRRPFYPRGRGRGFYPRRFQRGGGNYGYRNNNWQGDYKNRDHQGQHDSYRDHSPRRGRSRSRTRSPRRRSGSRSRSRSYRSSSGHSRHSSSSSRSSRSPRRRADKRASRDRKRQQQQQQQEERRSGSRASKDEAAGGAGASSSSAAAVSTLPNEPPGGSSSSLDRSKWKGLTEYETSPKLTGTGARPGASMGASAGSDTKNPTGLWRTIGQVNPPDQSPPKSSAGSGGASSATTGFGFFSKGERPGDKNPISTAFKKFLAEQGKKTEERENGREGEPTSTADAESGGAKASYDPSPGYSATKSDKSLPFLDEDLDLEFSEERKSEVKPPSSLTARDLAEERFGKWDDSDYPSTNKEPPEDVEEELRHMEEEMYLSRKQARGKEERSAKKKEKKKNRVSPTSPTPAARGAPAAEGRTRPLFPVGRDDSPPSRTGKREEEFANFTIKPYQDEGEGGSTSGSMAKERRLSRDLVHPSKKDQEFRSIFQHIQAAQLRRSPSELYAQHIVTIVHHIKAQHFRSSGMTLNERFAMYQRRATEMEMLKPKKSPEIHRRIDVSPSAFKRHAHLFEDFEESSYKEGKKYEGDLRLDIERRKKYPPKDREHKREGGKGSGGSQGPSRERSPEKSSKHHKKSKKSKKKRERSPSSSSSSSSPSPSFRGKEYMGEEMEHMEEGGYGKMRMGGPRDYPMDRGPRDYEGHGDRGRGGYGRGRGGYDGGRGGFQPRIRGRGWGRGNYPGNNNNGNPQQMGGPPVRPPEEEWDPEYTPKSRKYYLHDDRDGENKWVDMRGRGRGGPYPRGRGFVFRKGTGGGSPKWTHDMFQGSEEGELGDSNGSDVNHKEEDKAGDAAMSKM